MAQNANTLHKGDNRDNNNNNNNNHNLHYPRPALYILMQKAANQGTGENSHIMHCTHTSKSTNILDEAFNMESNITCITNCNYCTTTTLCTREIWFVLRI
jgi:hypothetical protein